MVDSELPKWIQILFTNFARFKHLNFAAWLGCVSSLLRCMRSAHGATDVQSLWSWVWKPLHSIYPCGALLQPWERGFPGRLSSLALNSGAGCVCSVSPEHGTGRWMGPLRRWSSLQHGSTAAQPSAFALRFSCPASAKGNPLPVFPCLPACPPPRCSCCLRCPVAAHRAHRANHRVKKDTDAEENWWTKKTLNAIKPRCLCVILSSQVPFLPSQFHACVPILLYTITWKHSHDTHAAKVRVFHSWGWYIVSM